MPGTSIIVALGASNTAGYGVARHEAFPAVLEQLLKERGLDVTVVNAGVSGQPTAGMLARLDRAVPADTRIVIFQPGSNDLRLGYGNAVREANIALINERLAARGIRVVRVAAIFDIVRAEGDAKIQSDGIHFTPTGYARIAALLVGPVCDALGMT